MSSSRKNSSPTGFTLIELLVGMAVLSLLMVILLGVINQTSTVVRKTHAQVEAFQGARAAIDLMTRTLSQATLNTYWDYYNSNDERRSPANASWFKPAKYDRASDLHFLIEANPTYGQQIYFQSPLGVTQDAQQAQTQGLLNACSYYVDFGGNANFRPDFISKKERFRYRLMQAVQPTESMTTYLDTTSKWKEKVSDSAWPIAENIIALVIWPRLSLAEDPRGISISSNYLYDSRNGPKVQKSQLPPAIQITVIAIDETSAIRMEAGSSEPAAIAQALSGKFANPVAFQEDLKAISASLTDHHIGFEIFTSVIPIRESKWSPE